MSRFAPITLACLSIFLGMFFFFLGFMKVSPALHKEVHIHLRKSFVRYVKVIPFLKQLGLKIQAKHYRITIGIFEMIFGLILAFIPGKLKQFSNILLLILTWGAIYTHVMIGDDPEKMYPAFAFSAFLLVRFCLHYLVADRSEREKLAATKQKIKGKTDNTDSITTSGGQSEDGISIASFDKPRKKYIDKDSVSAGVGENKKRRKKKMKEN